ncbi:MAG: hypothetical protein CVV27_18865 [Candidatus Melainabacteria bacterium HGW-Melainabacteria-1]|nr:MAG: hypothetical protein CVV27_18865 [Candidatus Melainabacteria bacterium HGW-Melainabacteria-1]
MRYPFHKLMILTMTLSLTACGPGPNPTPKPSPSPTVSPTPTPTASPTPNPNENANTYFFANLTGSQEVPPVSNQALGSARLVLTPGKSEAEIQISVSGLSGPITGAHIHRGQPGQAGPVVKELEVKGNWVSGIWRRNDATTPFNQDLLEDLENGNLYLNVHTAANPNGEVRGQLTQTADQLHVVYLSAGFEVPPANAGATGIAIFRVRPDGSQVTVDGYAHHLSGEVTGAHLHRSVVGTNGPVIKPLTVDNNNHFLVTWRKTDADSPLTDELLEALRKGEIYINLHTVIHPNGELRGQIGGAVSSLNTNFWFSGQLDPGAEVPPVISPAAGVVELKLNAESSDIELEGYVSGLSGPITGAHIHQGATGINGPVVKNLSIVGDKISTSWKLNDANQPLTQGLLADLLLGNLYVNVHTAAHPGGEVRTQLTSTPNRVYAIGLSGAAEVPAVNTSGKASAWVMLSPDHKFLTLKGKAHQLSGPITGAHIHAGPEGLAGAVVKDLVVSNGNEFQVTWAHTDQAQPLTAEMVGKLLAGELYINLHTAAVPNGEVRGQIK